jgi:CYTH domain-containing protein
MAAEIERKFLVAGAAWRTVASEPVLIRQGYLSRDPHRIVRVIAPYQDLIIAEIELNRSDDSFAMPAWLADEIAYDHRYSNSNPGTAHGMSEPIPHL